jgi:hypothetical protein
MKRLLSSTLLLTLLASIPVAAQTSKASANSAPGLLTAAELKQLVPANVFFEGQTAPAQLRNSAGFRTSGGKLVFAFLVDTSGYASDVAQKYQGYVITEVPLTLEGKKIQPGSYCVGFPADGSFHVMDVGGNDLATAPAHTDSQLHRPVPLQMIKSEGGYRVYFGRRYVQIQAE